MRHARRRTSDAVGARGLGRAGRQSSPPLTRRAGTARRCSWASWGLPGATDGSRDARPDVTGPGRAPWRRAEHPARRSARRSPGRPGLRLPRRGRRAHLRPEPCLGRPARALQLRSAHVRLFGRGQTSRASPISTQSSCPWPSTELEPRTSTMRSTGSIQVGTATAEMRAGVRLHGDVGRGLPSAGRRSRRDPLRRGRTRLRQDEPPGHHRRDDLDLRPHRPDRLGLRDDPSPGRAPPGTSGGTLFALFLYDVQGDGSPSQRLMPRSTRRRVKYSHRSTSETPLFPAAFDFGGFAPGAATSTSSTATAT